MATVRARAASSIKCFKLHGAYRHSRLNYLKNDYVLCECVLVSRDFRRYSHPCCSASSGCACAFDKRGMRRLASDSGVHRQFKLEKLVAE
ncbi:unnamed protein product [Danaus chrysippus]|uniref:(African queen) hypothetical protein n=1 Tax=Danaus chrysippus TaxID=151541 RepID=A0A8J2VVK3_9NEOP|nr:unnamed protein product [Danaus chrysippus]